MKIISNMNFKESFSHKIGKIVEKSTDGEKLK